MLYKTHSDKYLEDFGLLIDRDHIHLFEAGLVRVSKKLQLSPVLRIHAMWLDKSLKVTCKIASTEEEKKVGLQSYKKLDKGSGLFFPYGEYTDVTFHQGSVSFPLDVIFIRDSEIIKIEADTKVGSTDRWHCRACTSVIEVNAGYCFDNDINVGDRLVLNAVSEYDLQAIEEENRLQAFLEEEKFISYNDNNNYYDEAFIHISNFD